MPLTELDVRKARPKEKPYKLSDGGGLFLLVDTNGSRLWRKAYRFGGKQKLLAIGTYPTVSLSAARQAREEAKRTLAVGKDPSQEKRLSRLKAKVEANNTFELIAAEFVKRQKADGRDQRTIDKLEWQIRLADRLAKRPISEITPIEIYDILQRIERSGRLESARRLRGTLSRVFRFAVVTARATTDPAAPLVGATRGPKVTHHAAIVDEEKVGGLVRACRGYEGASQIRVALNLLPLVLVRQQELRYATAGEFSLDEGLWTIPAERMKTDRLHLVPLSSQAIELLRPTLDDLEAGAFVFPSVRSRRRPISENTINACLRRLGYTVEEMTGHGWRTTAKTIIGEHGWDDRWSERQLAHKDANNVREAYDSAQFLSGRAEMLQWWADYLDALAANKPTMPANPPNRGWCARPGA